MCGAATANNIGPVMVVHAGFGIDARQPKSSCHSVHLCLRCTIVNPQSEPALFFRHFFPFLSRDGERPLSSCLSEICSFSISFRFASEDLICDTASSSRCEHGHISPFGQFPFKFAGHQRGLDLSCSSNSAGIDFPSLSFTLDGERSSSCLSFPFLYLSPFRVNPCPHRCSRGTYPAAQSRLAQVHA